MIIRFNDPEFTLQALTLRFLRDGKILLKFGEAQGIHYTLHPGIASGIIDLHKTDERFSSADPLRHQTLVRISRAAIEQKIGNLAPSFVTEMIGLWRRLRLGWMIRRRLVVGPRFPIEDDLQDFEGLSIKAGPVSCAEPLATRIKPPEFYEEILERPNLAYSLFDGKKHSKQPYGLVISYRGPYGDVKLAWAKSRDLRHWAKKWEPYLLEIWAHLHPSTSIYKSQL